MKKGEVILRFCHPGALQTIRNQIAFLKRRWTDVAGWAKQRDTKLKEGLEKLLFEQKLIEILMSWIINEETTIIEREKIPLPEEYDAVHALLEEHKQVQEEATKKQDDYDKVTKHAKKRMGTERRKAPKTPGKGRELSFIKEYLNPAVTQLAKRWQNLWLLLMDRLIRLQAKLDEIRIQKASAEFNWEEWRERFKAWLRESKSRVSDLWRKKDQDRDNKLNREEFVEAIIETTFVTERWEIELVFNMLEYHTLISYKDFVDSLKNKAAKKKEQPKTDADRIRYEIEEELEKCMCQRKYQIVKISEGKYYFGESQKLRLVRFMRTSVMVRVGGGWDTLQGYLLKNDPCRAEGKTSYELRETMLVPGGGTMQAFKFKRPGVSRESSSTGLRPRIPSREASGEIKRSGIPRRQKSDLEREQRKIPTYGQKDYSRVRGSGYGASPSAKRRVGSQGDDTKPRLRLSGSGLSSGSKDSVDADDTPKITRERSGDVFSRLYGTRKSGREVKPRTPSSTAKTASAVQSPIRPRVKAATERKEGEAVAKTPSSPATKPAVGGVFARLTSTGTATKKAIAESASDKGKKTPARKSLTKDQKREQDWKSVRSKK